VVTDSTMAGSSAATATALRAATGKWDLCDLTARDGDEGRFAPGNIQWAAKAIRAAVENGERA
jgi:hypothetical protein